MTSALDTLLGPADTFDWPAQLGDHLSASRLSALEKCPEQYRRKYLLGEWEPKSVALHWGGAHHRALEANFAQKITSHEDMPVDAVLDAFRDAFVTDTDAVVWAEDEKPAEIMDAGVRLVRAYHELVAPRVQPLAVEEAFSITIPGVPVPVIGRIDLRGLIDNTARRTLEFKTSNKSVSAPKDDWRLQGRVYYRVHQTPVEWHVCVKSATPAVYTALEKPALLFEPSAAMAATTDVLIRNRARLLVSLYQTFGPDDPWPDAVEHQFACNYCNFGPTRGDSSCAYWGAS